MPYKLSWYVPKRVIHAYIEGEMGLEQLNAMMQEMQMLSDEGIAPIHVFLDDEKAGKPPLRIKELTSALNFGKVDMERFGWFVGVGKPNNLAKVMIPLLTSLLKVDHKRLETFEEALDFLSKVDATLDLANSQDNKRNVE